MSADRREQSDSVRSVLAYDLGGTKVAAGIVDSRGKILSEVRAPVLLKDGPRALVHQMAELGRELIRRQGPVTRVGIASAGPLHPSRGLLLEPTNMKSRGKGWGEVPIVRWLSRELRLPVVLENDAAAALLAEKWLGVAKKNNNVMILTLGTGLGTAALCNGELVRAGRGLHTEAGHIKIHAGDRTAICGCGNFGCAEAYLSASGFARRYSKLNQLKAHLPAEAIADLARAGKPRALRAFSQYSIHLAYAIETFVVLYAPELIVFTGSFADSSPLFLKQTRKHLLKLLTRRRVGIDLLPRLKISSLRNRAGLLGGAYIAFHRNP